MKYKNCGFFVVTFQRGLTFLYELDINKAINILFSLSGPVNFEGISGQERPCDRDIEKFCFTFAGRACKKSFFDKRAQQILSIGV